MVKVAFIIGTILLLTNILQAQRQTMMQRNSWPRRVTEDRWSSAPTIRTRWNLCTNSPCCKQKLLYSDKAPLKTALFSW